MSVEQQLRDRINLDKWHDAGLLNGYRPDDVFTWPLLSKLLIEAADEIAALKREHEFICRKCGLRQDTPNQIEGKF